MDGTAGLLGQEKKDPGTEGVPGSPARIGRGSLIRIVNHPLLSYASKASEPLPGRADEGRGPFRLFNLQPLNCYGSSREDNLAPESFTPKYTSSIL